MSAARRDSIAIVGMGCRFPGDVDTHAALWALLREGRQAIEDIPADRVDIQRFYDPAPQTPGRTSARFGGYLRDIDRFDADFFGLAPRDAERLDPQHRLLLETAWEALEDAGIDIGALDGDRVGVFVGQWLADFEQRLFAHPEELDFSMTLGSGRYAASGRIAYAFDFTGPSITVDTACSSSLTSVHMAVQSLRSGESSLALAGGVNVILGPHIHIAYSQSGMMAADGRCKFGDARADGYVRSEGAGLFVLKRLDDALRDGDRIHAVIRGSAVNNDGRSSGSMGTPSLRGQQDLLRCALDDAGLGALDIDYVEAHGTGTRAGDKVEIGALAAVLGQGRSAERPLYVGSVKTNLGHAESAAGAAGLMKAVLAVREGEIPATLNLETPSPDVAWDAAPLVLPRVALTWPEGRSRRAGVSGFGISGANAHVIVEGPPAARVVSAARSGLPAVVPLLPLSARSEASLRALAGKVAAWLVSPAAPELADVLRFAQTRRAALDHRAVFLATDVGELVAKLRTYADGQGDGDGDGVLARGTADPRRPAKVALVFPGQGGQWSGMARTLLAEEPVFRASLERADEVIRREAPWSLLEQLALDPGDPGYLGDRIDVIQPMLGALAIAYAEWMTDAGLAIDSVVGHSMGEAAAAHVAGALSLDEALRILCKRSDLMRGASGVGAMALVDLPAADVSAALAGFVHEVAIAAVNSARSTVISGDRAGVTGLVARFNASGVFSRLINVDVASHSPHMEGPAAALREALAELAPRTATTPFASALRGCMASGEALNADYWARNLRETVQFSRAIDALAERGVDVFLELGPHPVLGPSIEQAQTRSGSRPVVVCCGRRDEGVSETERLLGALATLWCAGARIDFARGAASPASVVDFPLYAWNRRRFWVEGAGMARVQSSAATRRAPDAEAREWVFQTVWRAWTATATAGATVPSRDWLLIGAHEPLVRALGALGVDVATAPIAELEMRLSALAADTGAKEVNVVVVAPAGTSAAFLPLRAARALRPGAAARFWFVTHDAQAPRHGARVDVEQAALWGAARVLADERPDLWGGLLDLSSRSGDADARAGAAWLLAIGDEDLAAVRDGGVQVPRLSPVTSTRDTRTVWRADATYLLTGGLGDVGLAVARAMVEEGARRLVLMNRGGLPARRTWPDVDPASPTGARIAAVRALESLGASIHCPAVDVSSEAAIAAFLADHRAEGWPPIRGVVHLAGVLDRRLIDDTDERQFDAALAGKLRGAQALDRLLPDLDCFVLFSSMTTVTPQPGIAAYVAANAGLEALALDRHARGVPATAIAWGQWRAGMLADDVGRAVIDAEAQKGVGVFSGERGAALFSWAAAQGHPVIAVAPVDWKTYGAARSSRNEPLLKDLKRRGAAPASDGGPAPGVDALADLLVIVRECIARTLQLPIGEIDPNREFGAMGLTSLLALELRNRLERALGRPLSATLAWNFPTIARLAAHLSGSANTRPGTSPAVPPVARGDAPSALATRVAAVAELSDADALLALRRRPKAVSS